MYVCTNNDDEEWGNKHYTTSVWHRYLWQSEEEPRIPTVCVIYKYIYIYIIYMVLDNIDTHRESAQLLFFVLHCITTIWWFIFFKGMKDACSFLMFWSKSNPCSLSTSTSSSCWSLTYFLTSFITVIVMEDDVQLYLKYFHTPKAGIRYKYLKK